MPTRYTHNAKKWNSFLKETILLLDNTEKKSVLCHFDVILRAGILGWVFCRSGWEVWYKRVALWERFSEETNSERYKKVIKFSLLCSRTVKEQLWGDKKARKMSDQINGSATCCRQRPQKDLSKGSLLVSVESLFFRYVFISFFDLKLSFSMRYTVPMSSLPLPLSYQKLQKNWQKKKGVKVKFKKKYSMEIVQCVETHFSSLMGS